MNFKKRASLLSILTTLTLLAIIAQVVFFTIHYKVSDLLDSLVQSSMKSDMLHSAILLPLFSFLCIQIFTYAIFIAWIWFLTISICELFKLPNRAEFWIGIVIWFISCCTILELNNYFFPDSFFAKLIPLDTTFLFASLLSTLIAATFAYINFFWHKRHQRIGSTFLLLLFCFASFSIYDNEKPLLAKINPNKDQPNVILIGLDSVRPDYIGVHTPFVNEFINSATVFDDAYTPLARTFTGWMSILTGQYPKHTNARSNLANPNTIHAEETLATRLKQIGYETIYGTDEKRFSNITKRYGFDHLIGPKMGVDDFILGSLSDSPLANLLINSSLGRFLFPYNFANRAAAITYEPDSFLQLVKVSLEKRSNKPIFLAIHLCVSHWPYTWARDKQPADFNIAQRYASSVEEVDQQLGELLAMLKANGLLEHSLVVLLSDHGTTLGLPDDRTIRTNKYEGDPAKLKWLQASKLCTAPSISNNVKHDITLDTSYGQGTDVLSLKQYHVLLAFRGFGIDTRSGHFNGRTALMDIAPTILDMLNLPQMKHSDGISLKSYLLNSLHPNLGSRPLFMETGYSLAEIQTNDIFMEKVLAHAIGAYQIDPHNGHLFFRPEAERAVNFNRQRAVLLGNWLLARYPTSKRLHMVNKAHSSEETLEYYRLPPFYVIANIKTGAWGIGLDSPIAQAAPTQQLLKALRDFYGDEI